MNLLLFKEFTVVKLSQWLVNAKDWRSIFLVLLCIVLSYCLFLKPNFAWRQRLLIQGRDLQLELARKQKHAMALQQKRQQLSELGAQYSLCLKQFFTGQNLSALLEKIWQAGMAKGLTFELFTPLPEIAHGFYKELPIKMIMKGHYQQLALFLSHIAQWHQIITVHDIELVGSVKDREKLSMMITIKVYYQGLSKALHAAVKSRFNVAILAKVNPCQGEKLFKYPEHTRRNSPFSIINVSSKFSTTKSRVVGLLKSDEKQWLLMDQPNGEIKFVTKKV